MVSLVADLLLEKLVGRWLRLDGRKLDLSGGALKLKNVELRHDAFGEIVTPVAVRGGLIGELEIEVPWTKLKTESVVVKVHQPVILLTPHSESDWDEALEAQRAAVIKAQALQALRDVAAAVGAKGGSADESGGSSFVDRTVRQVIENMQLLITGAIVRYEDFSHSTAPFAVEIAWDSLWIHPAHVTAPVGGASSARNHKEKPPFEHREVRLHPPSRLIKGQYHPSMAASRHYTPCRAAPRQAASHPPFPGARLRALHLRAAQREDAKRTAAHPVRRPTLGTPSPQPHPTLHTPSAQPHPTLDTPSAQPHPTLGTPSPQPHHPSPSCALPAPCSPSSYLPPGLLLPSTRCDRSPPPVSLPRFSRPLAPVNLPSISPPLAPISRLSLCP